MFQRKRIQEIVNCQKMAELKYYKDATPQRHLFKQYGIEVDE